MINARWLPYLCWLHDHPSFEEGPWDDEVDLLSSYQGYHAHVDPTDQGQVVDLKMENTMRYMKE